MKTRRCHLQTRQPASLPLPHPVESPLPPYPPPTKIASAPAPPAQTSPLEPPPQQNVMTYSLPLNPPPGRQTFRPPSLFAAVIPRLRIQPIRIIPAVLRVTPINQR